MSKNIIIVICMSVFLSINGYAKIKITQKKQVSKAQLKTEKVSAKKMMATKPFLVPLSDINRNLIYPKGVFEGTLGMEYRNFAAGSVGLNVDALGRYSYFDDWDFTVQMSSFPQSEAGFEFGGFALGFLYEALVQDAENPEIAVGMKSAFFGKGILSLTKDNSFALFPTVQTKKKLLNNLSLEGGLTAGIGNKSSGIASINTAAILKTTPEIDFKLKLDLQNLGFELDEILSLTPTMKYHIKRNLDLAVGVHVGLIGAGFLGNNVFFNLSTRL
jgi:hypothetical protein